MARERCSVCNRHRKFGSRLYPVMGQKYCWDCMPYKCNEETCKKPLPEEAIHAGVMFCRQHARAHYQRLIAHDELVKRTLKEIEFWENEPPS